MPRKSIFKNRALTLDIQANKGTGEAVTPTSVLLTEELSVEVLAGDKHELNFDQLGKGGRSVAQMHKDPHNIFGWKTPIGKAVGGTMPSWLSIFRACGFNILDNGTHWVMTHASQDETDYATIRVFQDADASTLHQYAGIDGTGNLSLEMEAGELAYMSVANFMTSYIRPEEVGMYVPDYGTQLTNVAEIPTYLDTNVVELDGTGLCLKKLTIPDADGRDLGRDRTFCGDTVVGKEKPVVMKATFINPNWGTEINPFEISEAIETIQRLPFIFDHGLMRIFAEEVQPLNPVPVEIGHAGLKGIEMDLNVLAGFEISVPKNI